MWRENSESKGNTLTHWRANLIGPDCFRWKGKILYHARDIEEWFKINEAESETKPEKNLKRESVALEKPPEAPEPIPELQPEPDPESEPDKEWLTPIEVSQKYDISHKTAIPAYVGKAQEQCILEFHFRKGLH